MASQIQVTPGPFLGAPPALPLESAQIDPALKAWLQRFMLWCQGNFNSTIQKRTATGALFMQSSGGKVFSITVSDAGALVVTQMNPGQGP